MNAEGHKQIDEALAIVEQTGVELVEKGLGMDIILFALEYEVQAVKENIIDVIKAMPIEARNEILQLNGGSIESYLESIHLAVIRSITMQIPTKTVTPAKIDHKTLREFIPK